MSTAGVVIGLDVGTTAVKAVAFRPGSPWRHAAVREYPSLRPHPGWQVQDPDLIVAGVLAVLRECVTAAAPTQVLAVSVGTAMHGLLALDAALTPLTPLLTWADSRAEEEARALHASGEATALQGATGTPVHPMSPLTKLLWFARTDPRTCQAARWWIGLKDYVLHRLTGQLVTELSSASATGLLELATADWYPAALELAGVQAAQLPEVLPPTAVLGCSTGTAASTGLPAGTPVVVGAADGPLGNLGTSAMSRGTAALNLGTSGAVRVTVDRPTTDPTGRLFCYALTERHWVVGGAISNGGDVVRWAAEALAPDVAAAALDGAGDEALLALAAAVPPGSEGLVMLPYLLAERAPLWDVARSGSYLGLRRGHTRAHFVRAAVEGVCLQLSGVLDALGRVAPVTSVRATGGAFRSELWRRSVTAAVARPTCFGSDADGGALAAAALGLYALGAVERLEEAVPALAPETFAVPATLPDPDHVRVFERLRREVVARADELSRTSELMRERTGSAPVVASRSV